MNINLAGMHVLGGKSFHSLVFIDTYSSFSDFFCQRVVIMVSKIVTGFPFPPQDVFVFAISPESRISL